jgi:hypothetical protein
MMLRSGIEEEELRETGGTVAADDDTQGIVLRRVFAKTVGSQRGERAIEIIGAESEMAIGAVYVPGPKGAGRIEGQMHLLGAASEPGAGALEGRPLNDREAEQVLIEGKRPRQIGDDEINMVERKLSHGRRLTPWLGKAIRQVDPVSRKFDAGRSSLSVESKQASTREARFPISTTSGPGRGRVGRITESALGRHRPGRRSTRPDSDCNSADFHETTTCLGIRRIEVQEDITFVKIARAVVIWCQLQTEFPPEVLGEVNFKSCSVVWWSGSHKFISLTPIPVRRPRYAESHPHARWRSNRLFVAAR